MDREQQLTATIRSLTKVIRELVGLMAELTINLETLRQQSDPEYHFPSSASEISSLSSEEDER